MMMLTELDTQLADLSIVSMLVRCSGWLYALVLDRGDKKADAAMYLALQI